MGKLIFRFVFILSILLNLSMAVHFFKSNFNTKSTEFVLNLTKQQKEKVTGIRQASHRKNERIKLQIKRCQEKMMEDLKAEEVNKESVFAHIRDIGALQERIQRNTIEEILAVKSFLNQQQCECFLDGLHAKLSAAEKNCEKECCQPKKNPAGEKKND